MNISQYEISGLFLKIDNFPLSGSDRLLLGAIISFYNSEKGFAFPSIQKLAIRSGLSEKTVDRSKKSLIAGGWLTIESGTGKGISNKYYINIDKIVDMAKGSGARVSNNTIPKIPIIEQQETHKRNISGLTAYHKTKTTKVYRDYGNEEPDWFPKEEDDLPF